MNITSKKKVHSEPSSCSESISFPSDQNDTNINYLLHVCYMEWVIMGILTLMIMIKMTDLEQEEWVWLKIFSGMLFIFSIPFTVGVHMHNDPSCDSEEHHPTKESDDKDDFKSAEDSEPEDESKKVEPSSKKKEPKFTLIKKPAKKTRKAELGKSENESSSSSEKGDSSAESSSSSTKVTRQKKRSKIMGTKNTARRTTKKTKVSRSSSSSSSTSSSSTSSQSEGFPNAKAEVIIKKESTIESEEEAMAGVNSAEENDFKDETKAEGEANVTAETAHGPDAGKESIKLDNEDDKAEMESDTEKK